MRQNVENMRPSNGQHSVLWKTHIKNRVDKEIKEAETAARELKRAEEAGKEMKQKAEEVPKESNNSEVEQEIKKVDETDVELKTARTRWSEIRIEAISVPAQEDVDSDEERFGYGGWTGQFYNNRVLGENAD
ncbi:hypothetical protein TWF281_010758 [Arthrobotrys megalospora]